MTLNIQQVKELSITEGDVRTIHDTNGNQLWGYVAYDTKYEGNITQQTYTGKNQFDINTLATGNITVVDGVATGTAGQFYTRFQNGITLLNTSSVMSITATAYRDGESSLGNGMIFRAVYTDTTFDNILTFPNSTTSATTLSGSTDNTKTLDKIVLIYGSGSSNVWHISNVQVEAGSTVTSYEPYVGGIPAPNPDYPQTVNVVTGTQTVTITADDQQSEDFTISLGSLELCKIGDYQDYIFKSDDDWYVHKATDMILSYNGESVTSDYISTTGQLTTGATVYYGLATPTDTQITDSTLVGQLNAVHEWLTRYGYNSSVSGNLPLLIEQTNLS